MKSRANALLYGSLVAALAIGFAVFLARTPAHARVGSDAGDAKRKADDDAIRKVSGEFSAALGTGDAKAVAAFWTDEGEYIGHDGTTLRGKAAVEEAYAKSFKSAAQTKVEMAIDSIRFVSQDTAIEEGYAKTQKDKDGRITAARYSTLYVRENGQWRIALVREWPEEGAGLRDIDWLIGTWTAKNGEGEVRVTYEWDENKKFIHVRFTIKGKDRTVSGTEIIARDPNTDGLRAWVFEGNGGFGSSTWSRQGKRWFMQATGVEADGGEMTATNILTPISKDSFTWQSVDRTVDGEEQPDIAPIKVTRVK